MVFRNNYQVPWSAGSPNNKYISLDRESQDVWIQKANIALYDVLVVLSGFYRSNSALHPLKNNPPARKTNREDIPREEDPRSQLNIEPKIRFCLVLVGSS